MREQVITCDRCNLTERFKPNDPELKNWVRASITAANGDLIIGPRDAPADLCPSCIRSLVAWMLNVDKPEPAFAEVQTSHDDSCIFKAMATGVFNTARTGQSLRYKRRIQRQRAMDRFAEELSKHDIAAGDPGGNIITVAARLGMTPKDAHAMLQRIRRELGGQAR